MKPMVSSFVGCFLGSCGRQSLRVVPRVHRLRHTLATLSTRGGEERLWTSRQRSQALLFLAASSTGVAFSAANTTSLSSEDEENDESQRNIAFPCDAVELDNYNGVIIRVARASEDKRFQEADRFQSILESSLKKWKEEGKRGIWIYLPTHMSHLVPICCSNGFDFHFAKKGSVVLKQWLPETLSRLPHGPTHQVGVGCMVTKGNGEMLVVQELTGPAARYKLWKMPTGLLDPGENINDAAVRELKEETGLDAKLYKILTFRQAHSGGDRGSDLFFVCWMKLIDENQEWTKQEEEIADIRWMPIEEFTQQELWQKSPVYQEMNDAMIRAIETDQGGMSEETHELGFRPGSNTIYIPSKM